MDAAPPTVTGLLQAQAGREQPGLLFEDRRWSWRERAPEFTVLEPEQAAGLDARLSGG